MQADTFNVLQDTDLLGLVVRRPGAYHNNANYVELLKLAGLNTSWRGVVAKEIAMPLRADADQFLLDVAILYQRGELAAIVKGLLHFRKFKHELLQLYAITALHVACTTGHYLTQSRRKKDIIVAGGVEVMISAMITNPSCVSLHIVCMRMIKMFASYKQINLVTWGWWTERQANAAIECIIHAMRRFSLSLDLQCTAIACLVALCVPGDALGDDQTYIFKRDLRRLGGLPLIVNAMHTHSDMAMYMDICRLIFMFSHAVLGWSQIAGGHNELVVLQALQHSLTAAHNESICFITKLLCQLCQETVFSYNIAHIPLATSLCEQSLQFVQAHIQTDTAIDTTMKQSTNVYTTTLLCRLTRHQNVVRQFALIPGSVNLLVQTLLESHNLCLLQPTEMFQGSTYVTMEMCVTTQLNICKTLYDIIDMDQFLQTVIQAGVLSNIFIVVGETLDAQVRVSAFETVLNIAWEDNGQSLLILRAGGLKIMANLILMRRNDTRIMRPVLAVIHHLAGFPVYATAMFELDFVHIMQLLTQSPHITNIIALLQLAATNPVYPP